MKITVTLDPDVIASIRKLARARRRSFEAALSAVLREGLASFAAVRGPHRFVVEPHDAEFRPGFDLVKPNCLSDQLETEAFVEKTRRRRRSSAPSCGSS